jgi:hypothetical protein
MYFVSDKTDGEDGAPDDYKDSYDIFALVLGAGADFGFGSSPLYLRVEALYRIPFMTKMEKDADEIKSKWGLEAKLALGYSF